MKKLFRTILNKGKELFYELIKAVSRLLDNRYFYVQFQMNDRDKSLFKESNRIRFDTWDSVRRDMFYLLMKGLPDGDIVECGVYKGHTARLLHYLAPERKLYLMDTFEGFGKEDGMEGVFSDTSVEKVFKFINPQNSNVVIIEGRIPESIPEDFKKKRFAMVHLDMDLYKPTRAALAFFYPRIIKGGCIVCHDYNNIHWPGIKKAVDEYGKGKIVQMPDLGGSVIIK